MSLYQRNGDEASAAAPAHERPLLEVHNLTKIFIDQRRGGRRVVALGGVSVDVERGQFVCLLGPSGCGKTTLIRIVAGLEHAGAGEVLLEGKRIEGPGRERCMVFQNYGLLPWRTVMGNVEFGLEVQGVPKKQRRALAQQQIEKIGLVGFESHYPHEISGGMQQRVGLARALTKDPKLLLMDEPFAAVDMHTREYLQDELLKIWRTVRTTVLFVTHSIEEAVYLGDRVLVMTPRPGQVRADIKVQLPRPRSPSVKAVPYYAELCHELREFLRTPEEPEHAAAAGGSE